MKRKEKVIKNPKKEVLQLLTTHWVMPSPSLKGDSPQPQPPSPFIHWTQYSMAWNIPSASLVSRVLAILPWLPVHLLTSRAWHREALSVSTQQLKYQCAINISHSIVPGRKWTLPQLKPALTHFTGQTESISCLPIPWSLKELWVQGNLSFCLILSAGMSTSSWMRQTWAPWVWRMLSCLFHSSLNSSKKDYFHQNFASCRSSKFSLQTISLTQSFYVPQASVQRVSAFLACNYPKPWKAQGNRRPTKGRKYDWDWARIMMAVVLLEEVPDILSGIWGGTEAFSSSWWFP